MQGERSESKLEKVIKTTSIVLFFLSPWLASSEETHPESNSWWVDVFRVFIQWFPRKLSLNFSKCFGSCPSKNFRFCLTKLSFGLSQIWDGDMLFGLSSMSRRFARTGLGMWESTVSRKLFINGFPEKDSSRRVIWDKQAASSLAIFDFVRKLN